MASGGHFELARQKNPRRAAVGGFSLGYTRQNSASDGTKYAYVVIFAGYAMISSFHDQTTMLYSAIVKQALYQYGPSK